MKLDSISTIAEVIPYYGKLDSVYKFMQRLNRKTNEMWKNTWVKISKNVKRRKIEIKCKNRREFVVIPLKYPLILTLFYSNNIEIDTEEKLIWLIELFQKFENPKMIDIYFEINLWKGRDANMLLSNYKNYMKMTEFDYKDQYNKLVEVAISREIELPRFITYIFINEIPFMTDITYINAIIFPWDTETTVAEMIKIWDEFSELKPFSFSYVKLIWDGMSFEDFLSIYLMLVNQGVKTEVIAENKWLNLGLFLNQCYKNQIYSSSFKWINKNEYILFEVSNEKYKIDLAKSYLHNYLNNLYTIAISKWTIILNENWSKGIPDKHKFTFEAINYLKFELSPITPKKKLNQNENSIYIDDKIIFDGKIIEEKII